jgi:hypothetical protein
MVIRSYCLPQLLHTAHAAWRGISDSQSYGCVFCLHLSHCVKPVRGPTRLVHADYEAYGECTHRFGSPKETSRWNQLQQTLKITTSLGYKYKSTNAWDAHISLSPLTSLSLFTCCHIQKHWDWYGLNMQLRWPALHICRWAGKEGRGGALQRCSALEVIYWNMHRSWGRCVRGSGDRIPEIMPPYIVQMLFLLW